MSNASDNPSGKQQRIYENTQLPNPIPLKFQKIRPCCPPTTPSQRENQKRPSQKSHPKTPTMPWIKPQSLQMPMQPTQRGDTRQVTYMANGTDSMLTIQVITQDRTPQDSRRLTITSSLDSTTCSSMWVPKPRRLRLQHVSSV